MANPYDFTSGFLTARQVRSQEKQADDIKEYREQAIAIERQKARDEKAYRSETAIPYYKAQEEKLRQEIESSKRKTKFMELLDPVILKQMKDLNPDAYKEITQDQKDNGNPVIKPNRLKSFDYTPTQSDIGVPDNGETRFVDADINPYVDTRAADGYSPVDGTDINNRMAIPEQADQQQLSQIRDTAVPEPGDSTAAFDGSQIAAATPKPKKAVATDEQRKPKTTVATDKQSPESMFSKVQQVDPETANSISKSIFGVSNEKFQKLIGAFSLIRFATGEGTPKELLDNVNVIKKMQLENVGAALSRGLAGDFQGAADAFAASGDPRGKDIKGFNIVKIKNDIQVPGKTKGLVDSYDGLEIIYGNNNKVTLDPRKLMAESIGLAEMVKFTTGLEEKQRDNQIQVDINSENARYRAMMQNDRMEQKQTEFLGRQLQTLEIAIENRYKPMVNSIKNPLNQTYAGKKEEQDKDIAILDTRRNLVSNIGGTYLQATGGNNSVSLGQLETAAEDIIKPNIQNFDLAPNGNGYKVYNFNRVPFARHKKGAYVPLNLAPVPAR